MLPRLGGEREFELEDKMGGSLTRLVDLEEILGAAESASDGL
jgi:hypothetical protein